MDGGSSLRTAGCTLTCFHLRRTAEGIDQSAEATKRYLSRLVVQRSSSSILQRIFSCDSAYAKSDHQASETSTRRGNMKIKASGTDIARPSRIASGCLSWFAAVAWVALLTTGNAAPIFVEADKASAELPRVSIKTADRLGLKWWRDLDSGKEVRRGQAADAYKPSIVIHNKTGRSVSYSLKWGQSGKWKSYIVERRTNQWHAFPAETAPIPYLRLENADGEARRM